MNTKLFFALFLVPFTCLFSEVPSYKSQMKTNLDMIAAVMEAGYAPKDWKKEWHGWELYLELDRAKQKIDENPSISIKDYQRLVRSFLKTTRDYHVNVEFHSTETASLPINIKSAEGRYFISYINRKRASFEKFPFFVGDEVISSEGRPIHEVIKKFQFEEFGDSDSETDFQLALTSFTVRLADAGHIVPTGKAKFEILPLGSDKLISARLNWHHVVEDIDSPFFKSILDFSHKKERTSKAVFEKEFVSVLAEKFKKNSFDEYDLDKEFIGSKKSFVPLLGEKLWEAPENSELYAYSFAFGDKRVGYIRIPAYTGANEDAIEFGTIINQFNEETDALIIDQVNNPGGSVMYLYSLVTMLIDKPIAVPKHRIILTQRDIAQALHAVKTIELDSYESFHDLQDGDLIQGYPYNQNFKTQLVSGLNALITYWNQGCLYTGPCALNGIEYLYPHPTYSYNKPIIVLTNALDFSGGDFFPAILQDNNAALIFGSKTAGAGGYVSHADFTNRFGIDFITFTGSIAERMSRQPIENLGVTPDVLYDLKVEDLTGKYQSYKKALLETLKDVLDKEEARIASLPKPQEPEEDLEESPPSETNEEIGEKEKE